MNKYTITILTPHEIDRYHVVADGFSVSEKGHLELFQWNEDADTMDVAVFSQWLSCVLVERESDES